MLVNAEGIAIDMPAGPSEVAVLADESANAEFIACRFIITSRTWKRFTGFIDYK